MDSCGSGCLVFSSFPLDMRNAWFSSDMHTSGTKNAFPIWRSVLIEWENISLEFLYSLFKRFLSDFSLLRIDWWCFLLRTAELDVDAAKKRIRIINTKSITPGKKHSSGLHLVLILMQSYSILSHRYSHSRPVSTLSGKSTSHVDCCSDADVHLLTVSISECQNTSPNAMTSIQTLKNCLSVYN